MLDMLKAFRRRTPAEAWRLIFATSAIAWGLTQLAELNEARHVVLEKLEDEIHEAEQRLGRLLHAEEEEHERAAAAAEDAVTDTDALALVEQPNLMVRRVGQVVPEQRGRSPQPPDAA